MSVSLPAVPESMTALVELAIREGEALDPKLYFPTYSVFHSTKYNSVGKCSVCLAGVLIASTLGAPVGVAYRPSDYPLAWENALKALDNIRMGEWSTAWLYFYGDYPEFRFDLPYPGDDVFRGWSAFRRHLESLKKILPELERIEQTHAPSARARA